MLEEDEQSASRDNSCTVHASTTSSADDSGVRMSHSPVSSQEAGCDRSDVGRDSLTACSVPASDIQSAASVDLLDEDPWLPVSTKCHRPAHVSARNSLIGGKSHSSSHLQCCNSASVAVLHSAVGCDCENSGSERCVASSNFQCRCAEKRSQKAPETRRSVDVDEVLNLDAGLRHNLTEIKEGVPANCFDTEHDRVNSTTHPSSTDSVQHSCRQSNSDHIASVRAGDLSDSSGGSRPTRKASLNGLRNAVRSVLIHRTSLITDCPANTDPCRPPLEISASGLSGHCTDKASRSTGSKQLSKFDRRNYFGSGRRSQRSVDSVRQSLTHLLRTGDHGSSVVGERMAVSCLEQSASSALTLAGTRRVSRRMLSGDFDDAEAAETNSLQPERSLALSGPDELSDHESDGLASPTCLSELNTSDSFYESRLFDALEVHNNDDADGGGGGFETDSSDGGTYSAESFSDLMPSDDQPTSSTSSHQSVDVDGRSERPQSRQGDPAATNNSRQDEHRTSAVAITLHLLHRAVRNVKSCRLTDGRRCSLTLLQQPSCLNDIADNASQRWKRLSL